MSTEELCDLGMLDLARLYRCGKLSPVEVVDAHLRRCEQLNPILNAFITLLRDSSSQAAKAAEAQFQAGVDLGLLQGVPVSVKDLMRVRGTPTTAGSRVLLQDPPERDDALVVQRLRAAGAVIIGKTNLHEFASGDPDPSGPFGLVQNPRLIGYHPGSSSSGAGASVASGLGVIAVGTDTGGSVRIPAYLCGVTGLKPTTGWISLDGVIPLSPTLDTLGFLSRRVSDLATALAACSLESLTNINTFDQAEHLRKKLERPVRGWRIGIPIGGFFDQVQPAVRAAFENTVSLLRDLGCQLTDIDPPGIEEMPELTISIIRPEAAACHEQYRDREHLYGPSFRERILVGRNIMACTYITALQKRLELQREWLALANQFDVLVVPSGPAVAPPHGVSVINMGGTDFPFRELLARFTRPFNLLGWPALSIPNGVNGDGLPTGVQIVGPPNSEAHLLTVGHQLEQVLELTANLGIEPRYPT